MRAGELCNREVVIARAEETIVEAARLMRHYHVGDVVVVDDGDAGNVPVAVLTDRDIVVEVVAGVPERVSMLTVGDIVGGREVATVQESASLSDVMAVMRSRAVRRLPVVADDSGVLVGILTYDDVVETLASQLADVCSVVEGQRTREERARP
jgi:CBS domain-containing protein